MDRPDIGRRGLLVSLGVVTVGTGLGLSLRWRGGDEQVLCYTDLLADLDDLERVGSSYLARYPAERDPLHIAREVFGGTPRPQERYDALLGAVKRRMERDFLEGRTFESDGWILSRTEGRLAALPLLLPAVPPRSDGPPGS